MASPGRRAVPAPCLPTPFSSCPATADVRVSAFAVLQAAQHAVRADAASADASTVRPHLPRVCVRRPCRVGCESRAGAGRRLPLRGTRGRRVITTVKVLGLRTRDPADLARAARAVVDYVQGGQPPAASGLSGYYGRDQARGRVRGSAAELVGLRGPQVSGDALARLLRREHAATLGRPLLGAAGSAGRAAAGRPDADPDREVLTLAEAALVAGVSASYLRTLAARHAAEAAATGANGAADAGVGARVGAEAYAGTDSDAGAGAEGCAAPAGAGTRAGPPLRAPPGWAGRPAAGPQERQKQEKRETLAAFKDPRTGRWMVRRATSWSASASSGSRLRWCSATTSPARCRSR